MVQMNFDARNIPFAEPGLPTWIGRVPVQIMRAEVKPTSANDGQNMLVLTVRALAGQYAGQENRINFNLFNRNPQAVEIAQRQLSSISHITNRLAWTDTDQLIGGQFLGVWVEQERDYTDPKTGQQKHVKGAQCNDFQLLDGRSIREAMEGKTASMPWSPNEGANAPPAGQQFQPGPTAGTVQPGGAPGFTPPPSGNSAPAGFAPPTGMPGGVPGGAPAQGGYPQMPAGPGMGTAGFTPPNPGAPPQGGFGAPGAFPGGHPAGQPAQQGFAPPAGPGAPQGGFAPPQQGGFPAPQGGQPQYQPQGQPQQGFVPPGQPQGGPGPWGPQ